MRIEIINQSKQPLPRLGLIPHLKKVRRLIRKLEPKLLVGDQSLSIVFVDEERMQALNSGFRKKDYATDILSFQGEPPEELGELVVCLDVLKDQAKRHKHPLSHEAVYLVLHGILHLLGYNHESGGRQAVRMYSLQDRVFESWRRSLQGRSSKKPSTKSTRVRKKVRSSGKS